MPSLGTVSLSRLTTCHPDLQILFAVVVEKFDCAIICGHRDEADQTAAYESGNSQVEYPNSKHNSYPSMAVDVAPYPVDWDDIHRFYYFAGQVMAVAGALYQQGEIEHEIRWGGDWDKDTEVKDNKFNDLVHFELIER